MGKRKQRPLTEAEAALPEKAGWYTLSDRGWAASSYLDGHSFPHRETDERGGSSWTYILNDEDGDWGIQTNEQTGKQRKFKYFSGPDSVPGDVAGEEATTGGSSSSRSQAPAIVHEAREQLASEGLDIHSSEEEEVVNALSVANDLMGDASQRDVHVAGAAALLREQRRSADVHFNELFERSPRGGWEPKRRLGPNRMPQTRPSVQEAVAEAFLEASLPPSVIPAPVVPKMRPRRHL